MNFDSLLGYTAAGFSAVLGLAMLIAPRRSIARAAFSAGMLALAVETVFALAWRGSEIPDDAAFWKTCAFLAKSVLPSIWLCFSLTYSRGNARDAFLKFRGLLLATLLLPVAWTLVFHRELAMLPDEQFDLSWWLRYHIAAKILHGIFLVAAVLILTNLERTFRAAVGTMQWRIKFVILGLAVIFGARIYTRSQALLFSGQDLALLDVEAVALLVGCSLITVAYFRRGFAEIDVYPSREVLQTSFTILLVAAYLLIVGVFAQIVAQIGEWNNFQLQALIVLVAIAALAVLLLSDRLRLRIGHFVSHHFKRPQHDSRQIWTRFTQSMSAQLDESSLCVAAAKLLSETFNALSVTIWRFDEQQRLIFAASTCQFATEIPEDDDAEMFRFDDAVRRKLSRPFDLDKERAPWARKLQEITATQFKEGGNRVCVPLLAGDQVLGFVILADRISGLFFTIEEIDLLKCIGDQLAASLLNLRLTEERMLRKEVEAFQTVSAFFVHDLKNAASTLGLTLQNLPDHFDDPAFREDALRGIKVATDRLNHMISRLSSFRHGLQLRTAETDLNGLIREILNNLNGSSTAEIVTKLDPLPSIMADREQVRSIITNLVLNARDAVGSTGRITVETKHRGEWVILSVSDNGCGMSAEFIKNSLFRPFHTTKKQGLGVGMFQAKMIVEAHSGNIEVKSEPGAGSSFEVRLPANPGEK